jgi:hypothetical protein
MFIFNQRNNRPSLSGLFAILIQDWSRPQCEIGGKRPAIRQRRAISCSRLFSRFNLVNLHPAQAIAEWSPFGNERTRYLRPPCDQNLNDTLANTVDVARLLATNGVLCNLRAGATH